MNSRGFGEGILYRGPAIVVVPALALALAACGGNQYSPVASTPVPVVAATPPPPPRVIIVSIDGLRPDALTKIESPNIDGLAKRGASTLQAQTVSPSNTLPAHISMLTGYLPSVHKVIWDEYLPARGKITVPTLFAAVKAAGKRGVMLAGKEKFNTFKDTGSLDSCELTTRGDGDVANMAIVQIQAGADLMFVHFPDVDLTGHSLRWMSPDYVARLGMVDSAIGRILAAMTPATTMIITADHGGRGNGHGTNDKLDMTIPWIIAGPGIRLGYVITAPVNVTDTAATAAKILGLSMPADISGRVVTEAFLPTSAGQALSAQTPESNH